MGIPSRPSRLVCRRAAEGRGCALGDGPKRTRTGRCVVWIARRIAADEKTGGVGRVESLSDALLPQWRSGLPHVGDLRYQLLTGIAGTLAWAREIKAVRAVFAVHEFVTDQTRDDKHAQNASDMTQFLERLTDGAIRNLVEGALVGPVRVPGNPRIPSVPLYIGKAARNTRVVRPSEPRM